LRFEPVETTAGYFHSIYAYLKQHGKPVAFYSDRHSIFRINTPNAVEDAQTQFERAMETLGIEIICANSPQAKGRVERINQTLQDRLVKELRLMGINNIETANVFLPKFIVDINQRFAVEPTSQINAHRACDLSDEQLNTILCFQYTRKLSKNLELSYENIIYQIKTTGTGYALRHANIAVQEHLNGQITLSYKGRQLEYTTYHKKKKTAEIISEKQLNQKIDTVIKQNLKIKCSIRHTPKSDHPWRNSFKKMIEPVRQCEFISQKMR